MFYSYSPWIVKDGNITYTIGICTDVKNSNCGNDPDTAICKSVDGEATPTVIAKNSTINFTSFGKDTIVQWSMPASAESNITVFLILKCGRHLVSDICCMDSVNVCKNHGP